jgi:hypothetical protein
MAPGANGYAYPRTDIARSWIKANTIGATANALIGFLVFIVARALGVQEADTGPVLAGFFSLVCIGAIVAGMALFGFLIAVVLRQKLLVFPMRNWVALHVGFGLILGIYSAYALMQPDAAGSHPPNSDLNSVMIGAAVGGALLGALTGTLQALFLGQIARGLGSWIAYSALGGTTLALVLPIAYDGPQDMFLNEILVEIISLGATVASAVIMLPAVQALERR